MSEEVVDAVDASQAADSLDVEAPASSPEGALDAAAVGDEGASSFDWDEWDGAVDGLPEEHREVGGRISSNFDTRINDKEAELTGLRELYDAMMMGNEDPRISKFQTEQSSFDERYNGLQEQFNDYKAQTEKAQSEAAQEWANKFEERHKDLLGDTKHRERMVELIDDGWEPEVAVQLLTMDEEFVKMAEEAKGDGVPDSYAIRLAEVSAGKSQVEKRRKSAPRPGARITAGATGAKNPQQALRTTGDSDTLDDRRMIAARAALKAVKGGRR
jgi:hypothetical protein